MGMQHEKLDEVSEEAARRLEGMFKDDQVTQKLEAAHRVQEVLDSKIETGEVLMLTEEDRALVEGFRSLPVASRQRVVTFILQEALKGTRSSIEEFQARVEKRLGLTKREKNDRRGSR